MGKRVYSKLFDLKYFGIFSILVFFIPIEQAYAGVGPFISWDTNPPNYNLNRGGVGEPPVMVTVTSLPSNTIAADETVDITLTSKDKDGNIIDEIILQLKEIGSSGVYKNDNLIFMDGDDLIQFGDTVTISVFRECQGGLPPPPFGGLGVGASFHTPPGFPPPPMLPPPPPPFGNCDPETIEEIGGFPMFPNPPTGPQIKSSSDTFGFFPILTETDDDSSVFETTINLSPDATDSSTNTLKAVEGDIISVLDTNGNAANALIIPNSNPSVGAIQAVIDGTVTATINPSATATIVPGPGPGTGGGGAVRPGLVVDSPQSDPTGSSSHEPPTIGPNLARTIQHVGNGGIAIDGNSFLVTKPFHQEFELYEMLTGQHTISNIVYCPRGVDSCNYIAIGVTPYEGTIDDAIWWIEMKKDLVGSWQVKVYDNTGKIGQPVTFTAQPIDNYRLATSLTVPFNNVDTPPLKLWVQVRDNYNGVRNFYFNEGVQFKDADGYPYVETKYEPPLKTEPLCINEKSDHRNSCAFEKVREWTTKNAEQILHEIMENHR